MGTHGQRVGMKSQRNNHHREGCYFLFICQVGLELHVPGCPEPQEGKCVHIIDIFIPPLIHNVVLCVQVLPEVPMQGEPGDPPATVDPGGAHGLSLTMVGAWRHSLL